LQVGNVDLLNGINSLITMAMTKIATAMARSVKTDLERLRQVQGS
jgi:hypothetical protein